MNDNFDVDEFVEKLSHEEDKYGVSYVSADIQDDEEND